MSAPSIVITLRLEEPVNVAVDAMSDGELCRLADYLEQHHGRRALIELAYEIVAEERAA